VDALHVQAKTLFSLMSPSCRQVMVLTGLIVAFSKAVPLLCLRGKWLQMSLNQVYETEADLQKTDSLPAGQERSPVDHRTVPDSVRRPSKASVPRRLRPRSPNGRVRRRIRGVVSEISSPGQVGQHHCRSPYQSFGDHCFMALPGLHPPKVVKATQHLVEDQQHHGPSLHQEGRGHSKSAGKGAGVGAPYVRPDSSGLHPHQGEHPGRCDISFPRDPGLESSPKRLQSNHGQMGATSD
jgi:hypothetical protein